MDTSLFYATGSALCFTLLGFWWLVVQFRHAELTRDAATRRFTFLVSLHFVIPGLVSIASLISPGALWRVAFGLAGLVGIAAAFFLASGAVRWRGPLRSVGRASWIGIPIYALVTLIAIVPDAFSNLGLDALQLEGFALLTILLLGILLAWFMFTSPSAHE